MPEQKIYNDRMAEILEAFDCLFNHMQEAVSLLEYRDGKYRYVQNNTVHKNITGYKDIQGMELEQVVGEKICESMKQHLAQCLKSSQSVHYEQEYNFESTTRLWQTEIIPVMGKEGIRYILLLSRDASEMKRIDDENEIKEYSKHIEFLNSHDALTGLYNRQYFEKAVSQLNISENLPIAVVMGDIDGLKIINDACGCKIGDILLRNVAELLRENCQPDHLIARWGGDEFAVFMPRTNLEQAEKVIQSIQNVPLSIKDLQCIVSFGYSVKNSLDGEISDILREAEESMLRHKLLNGKSYRNAIINILLSALYENSNETADHSRRLEEYCHLIGRGLGISSIEMAELSLLALLHDIGKVGIDSHILKKPGALTDEEWVEMKRHPEIGYRIVQTTPELSMIADLILSHHEQWNGKGYPYGLRGEEIPLLSRILAVADSFDAMTNDRVYRQGMCKDDALREIERNSGIQFDPTITRIFIENTLKQG